MKFVYVLSSDEKDYFCEQCMISMLSLRKHNSDAQIILLMDDKTEKTLVGFRNKIREIASDIIVETYEAGISKKIRSRLLKTSMRQLISGNFLFIDSDTVIADELIEKELHCGALELGMVLDKHTGISNNYKRTYILSNAKKMSYSAGHQNRHFNSGVIYVSESKIAHDFFRLWNYLYKETLQKGIEVDQTSLNEANSRMRGVITELGGEWNVQIDCGLKYISNAKVIHYAGYQPLNSQAMYFNTLPFKLCDIRYFEKIRINQCITQEVEDIVAHPKEAFKVTVTIPDDCVAYDLLFSNHMRILKFVYVKLHRLYMGMEKVYGKLFQSIYGRV